MNMEYTTAPRRPGFARTGCFFLAALALVVLLLPALVPLVVIGLPVLAVIEIGRAHV